MTIVVPATPFEVLLLAVLLAAPLIIGYGRLGMAAGLTGSWVALMIVGTSGMLRPLVLRADEPAVRATVILLLAVFAALLSIVPLSWLRGRGRWTASRAFRWLVGFSFVCVIPWGFAELTVLELEHRRSIDTLDPIRISLQGSAADWRMVHSLALPEYVPDAELLWRHAPSPTYNSQGLYGPEPVIPKPNGMFRIVTYGDSNTHSDDVPYWPEQLGRRLMRRHGATRFELQNAGLPGYASYQGLLRFERDLPRLDPDLIVVAFGWNDMAFGGTQSDREQRLSPTIASLQRILLRYKFFLFLRSSSVPQSEVRSGVRRVDLTDYRANLRRFVELARQNRATAVLTTRPHRETVDAIRRADEYSSAAPDYNDAVRSVAAEQGAILFDAQRIMENPANFVDECHLSADAHRLMGDRLYGMLNQAGALPD